MKFKKDYFALMELLDKKSYVEAFHYLYCDDENIVGTDGRVLLAIPCEDALPGMFIPLSSVKELKKAVKKGNIEIDKKDDGSFYAHYESSDEPLDIEINKDVCGYPDYKSLLKSADERRIVYRIKLDMKYLEKVFKSAKVLENSAVTISFSDRVDAPFMIQNKYEFLVAPLRVGAEEGFGFLGTEEEGKQGVFDFTYDK